SDNGIGIESEYQDQIFLLFKRLHGGGEFEGTGIGLAICKKIAEQHEGKIQLESRLGEGTTFYIHLPHANQAVIAE
ncbi:MAG: ATP-binding protein, partial [Bacteroidota bacterium]